MEALIRKITLQDNSQVELLIRDVMTEMGASGEGFAIHDPEVKNMYAAYSEPRSVYYVIEQNGLVLGGGGVAPLKGAEADICELRKMYFREELRGKGMGRKLLRLCLDDAKRFGFKRCYLETLTSMAAAQSLYRSEGFTKLCNPMGATGHHGCDTWYAKDL